jgi:hypothetical protein
VQLAALGTRQPHRHWLRRFVLASLVRGQSFFVNPISLFAPGLKHRVQ